MYIKSCVGGKPVTKADLNGASGKLILFDGEQPSPRMKVPLIRHRSHCRKSATSKTKRGSIGAMRRADLLL